MTSAAVILAGGRGTRSADPAKAKIAQEVEGRTLLAWHVELLEASQIRDVVVAAGHAGDEVEQLCKLINHPHLSITVVHEQEQRGTVAALLDAVEHLPQATDFLVILGDILMALPVDDFLRTWASSDKDVGVVVHPSTHPEDSDAVFTSQSGTVRVVPKSESRDGTPNMSSAGLFAINRQGLARYSGYRDFGSQVLEAAANDGNLHAFVTSHYLKDTGTAERLAAARQDAARGTVSRRGSREPRPALFLDRDGVIVPTAPEIYDPNSLTLLPGVADAIGEANRLGIPVLVVTNQPGIAKGFMTFERHEEIRARMDQLLAEHEAFVDDYVFCPHHPEAGHLGEIPALKRLCECRKPEPGMALALAAHHGVALTRSAMVGDTERDFGLAKRTGMNFVHVSVSCDLAATHQCARMAAEAIRLGIEVVTC